MKCVQFGGISHPVRSTLCSSFCSYHTFPSFECLGHILFRWNFSIVEIACIYSNVNQMKYFFCENTHTHIHTTHRLQLFISIVIIQSRCYGLCLKSSSSSCEKHHWVDGVFGISQSLSQKLIHCVLCVSSGWGFISKTESF